MQHSSHDLKLKPCYGTVIQAIEHWERDLVAVPLDCMSMPAIQCRVAFKLKANPNEGHSQKGIDDATRGPPAAGSWMAQEGGEGQWGRSRNHYLQYCSRVLHPRHAHSRCGLASTSFRPFSFSAIRQIHLHRVAQMVYGTKTIP